MRTHKSTRMLGAVIATVAAAALAVPTAFAAGPGPGGGDGGGGGGGGGDTTGSVYSDLVIALRDEAGAPILQKYVVPPTDEDPDGAIEYCVQPVSHTAIPGVSPTTNPVDGRTVWVVPLQGEWIADPLPAEFTGACDTQPQYAMFVKEAELERLNLARTADAVIAQKIADVELKLRFADVIALESTGRIAYDESVIDASPENAGMYQSLMKSGTIPGLPSTMAGPPALVGPAGTSNSQFDAWELAAMNIGAAAGKSVPLTIDAVEYYNRVIGLPDLVPLWSGVSFVQSQDPDNPGTALAGSERFVDYSGFSYNRSETFKGSVTWLDVPTLTWKVDKITNQVPFTNLSSLPEIGTNTLYGITAFAQLADDVRALCNFIPDNTYLPGFYMDVPGVDTTEDQLKAIHDPAVDLGTLPETVFQTFPFQMTASLLNPFGGELIDTAQLRLRVDAETAFAAGDVSAVSTADGQVVPFTVVDGDLVGKWGPDTGFPVAPGYNVSTTFDVTVAAGAPTGLYTVTLELVDVDAPEVVLAHETGTLTVNENVTTLLWGSPVPKYTTQGSAMAIPLQVYAPEPGTAELNLTVGGPVEDPATPESEALAAGDIKVFASNGTDMVAMPLSLDAEGRLVGSWAAALTAGFTPVTWYATVIEGAPLGSYTFGVDLSGGNALTPISVVVFAPETHGEQPPDSGEDTTAPVVTVTPVGDLGATAVFDLAADDDGTTFECMLEADGTITEPWATCTSPKTYTGLEPAAYILSVRGTNREGLVSVVVTQAWTVLPDTTPPVVLVEPIGTPGATATFEFSADEDGVTFECMLTKDEVDGAWESCMSPKTYSDLAAGEYVLSVRGTDTAGLVSAIATTSWTVDLALITITPVGIPGASATFTIATEPADEGATFQCQLTKGKRVTEAWAPCGDSEVTFSNLKPATYVLSVRGTDSDGNALAVQTYDWTVTKASPKGK